MSIIVLICKICPAFFKFWLQVPSVQPPLLGVGEGNEPEWAHGIPGRGALLADNIPQARSRNGLEFFRRSLIIMVRSGMALGKIKLKPTLDDKLLEQIGGFDIHFKQRNTQPFY